MNRYAQKNSSSSITDLIDSSSTISLAPSPSFLVAKTSFISSTRYATSGSFATYTIRSDFDGHEELGAILRLSFVFWMDVDR